MTLSETARITAADERRSARGGAFSMFVDSFDVYLPALVLPAAMAYFMPQDLPAPIRATFTTVLFTVGLLGRPIGSVIFGNLSDRIGRKRVTMLSGWGFTVVTLLMGLLPGYAAWGYGGIAVFAVLRLVGGIFLAGGYAAPIPLALEQARPHRRGRVGALIGVGAPGSFLLMNLLLFGVLETVPHDGFLSWGWRVPFFVGFLLGLVYLWHYRGVVEDEESISERRAAATRQPVVELFTTHRALITSVFLLVVAAAFVLLVVAARGGAPAWLLGVLYVVAKVVPSAPLGVILVYLNERFPASVRASGYGIGYMFGLILPGLYTVWLLALSALMPYEFTPVVLILFGGLLMFTAVRRGPETHPVP